MAMTPITIRDLSILVVEDNVISRQLVEFLLKALGYVNVIGAGDGKEALEIIARRSSPPNIILCDWLMPGMSGIELLSAIRDDGFQGIFIMVTAVGSLEAAFLAKTHGADGYLLKPVTKDGLQKVIEDAVARVSLPATGDAVAGAAPD